MILVTRKAVEDLPAWPLLEPGDLFAAITELKSGHGWEGTFDSATLTICLSKSGRNSVNAGLGQCLVLDGELRVVAPAPFLDLYETDTVIDFPEPEPDPEPEPEPEPQSSPDTAVPISRTVR